jgi:hypothetical protein
MPRVTETEEVLAAEVTDALAAEQELTVLEQELAEDPRFREFLQKQKTVKENITAFWKNIEEQMLAHDIKSIKGEWGSITIAERLNWDFDPLTPLPPKFYKKVADTTLISHEYRLTGKPPKGATPRISKYLTKRIK